MYRLHFDHCPEIPDDLKDRVAILKDSHTSNRGGRKQYWIDSANRLGLCDTSFGIHYGRDPKDPLPPIVECNSAGDLDEDVEFGMDVSMVLSVFITYPNFYKILRIPWISNLSFTYAYYTGESIG